MRCLLLFVGIICSAIYCCAQFQEVARFSTTNGLPTNTIYNCIEDHHGFLWISSDQGAVRFDGKRFQQFTTQQGLPDNEVLKVLKEKTGRIWIHSFKQTPAYFDDIQNKFVSAKEDTLLKDISSKRLLYCFNTLDGGMEFQYESGTSIFDNGSKYQYNTSANKTIGPLILKRINKDNYFIVSYDKGIKALSIEHLSNTKIVAQKDYFKFAEEPYFIQNTCSKNTLYCLVKYSNKNSGAQLICIKNLKSSPIRFEKEILDFKNTVNQLSITEHYIIASYLSNEFEIYDRKTKNLLQAIIGNYIVNSVFEDAKGTLWVCTTNKGIIKFKKPLLTKMDLPAPLSDINYMNVSTNKKGAIYLGTSDNRIIEIQDGKTTIRSLPINSSVSGWLRDILFSQNKVFAFSETGTFVNFAKPILFDPYPFNGAVASKCAVVLNDSILILGNYQILFKLNSKTEKVEILPNGYTRVTCLTAYNANIIYYGSIDGLHKYDIERKLDFSLNKSHPLLEERVSSICMTKDSILWVATASNGLVALFHDSVIAHITRQQGIATNSIHTISVGKKHQILIGTNEGISILDYSKSISKPVINNISTNDGLTSNIINKILFANDTIYAATDKGISIIPASLSIPTFDITIKLIDVKINEHDTLLLHHYELDFNQNSINLQFAGIELDGHFKNAQLSLNEGETWADIEGNNLSLQLGSGEHRLWLRAVDMNRIISKQILKLEFSIDTPFYKSWWFGIIVSIILLSAAFYTYTRFAKRKHQQKVNEFLHQKELDELEIQALKAQINPHFVFNCLNSIRGFIYDEDFENADLYLQKFSQVLRSTLKFSSKPCITLQEELEFIDTYLVLEKLRFGDKFEYSINLEEGPSLQGIMIPAMLLQPFVENAINHGVDHLVDKTGKILVNVYLANDKLHITIDDNGIGREKAREIKLLRNMTHESKGMQLTQRRMELYHITMKIIDKKDKNGQACGTTIYFEIPILLNKF